jgi:tetratricopeptide (TPR) repeat protein
MSSWKAIKPIQFTSPDSRSIMSNSDDYLETAAQVAQKFQQGQYYFEAGRYREAIQSLSQACALVEPNSKAEGEMNLWLVTAYDASGRQDEALSLCRKLTKSPFLDIRKKSRRLLTILEAPKLSIHEDWLTKIPPLEAVNEPGRIQGIARPVPPPKPSPKKPVIDDQEIDLSQVRTHDQGLVVLTLVLILLLGAGLFWMA